MRIITKEYFTPDTPLKTHLIQFILGKEYSFGIRIIDHGDKQIKKQLDVIKEACKNIIKFIEEN